MNTQKKLSLALAGLALTSAQPVFASSHREAPLIAEDPAADNTAHSVNCTAEARAPPEAIGL